VISNDHIVYVVDDDRRICEALADLLATFDLRAVTFQSAADYIAFLKPDVPACLILDVDLPDITGLELQKQIAGTDHPPIIFVTGHGDIPSSVEAMKLGAVDFLTKPYSETELMQAVNSAIDLNCAARQRRVEVDELRQRLSTLTPRELEVLPLVASGLLNKQVASELGISEITVQIHRGNVMHKMGADSFADLVRMAAALAIPVTHSRRGQK
jgi:FixJ family two-component response regulator